MEAERADLLQHNAALELEQSKQQALLDSRHSRILELEKQIESQTTYTEEWKLKFCEIVAQKKQLEFDYSRQVCYELTAFRPLRLTDCLTD